FPEEVMGDEHGVRVLVPRYLCEEPSGAAGSPCLRPAPRCRRRETTTAPGRLPARRTLQSPGLMRTSFLPFARPALGEEEIAEVVDTLKSGWITTGPKVERFTAAFAAYVEGRFAVPVSSATAGLHVALLALGVGPGDEVITTPLTFVATLNTIVQCGAVPVLAD